MLRYFAYAGIALIVLLLVRAAQSAAGYSRIRSAAAAAARDWRDAPLQLAPPRLPLALERPTAEMLGSNSTIPYNLNQWAEAEDESGIRYVVFTHAGLVSDRDIYLAIRQPGKRACAEILPTGLSDGCVLPGPKGPWVESWFAPLRLQVSAGRIVVGHHAQASDAAGALQTAYRTDTLAIADLRRDSDGDRLTDVAEALLLTQPRNPDSDGDGLLDGADPTPLVDAAGMGPVERGTARALQYFYNQPDYMSHRPEPGPAFSAFYFNLRGCGPVAFSVGGAYGVCLTTDEQSARLSAFRLSYRDDDVPDVFVGAAVSPLYRIKLTQPDNLQVYLAFDAVAYIVELARVEDEYYPLSVQMSWIE